MSRARDIINAVAECAFQVIKDCNQANDRTVSQSNTFSSAALKDLDLLSALRGDIDQSTLTRSQLGQASLSTAIACLRMYLPSHPYDPALRSIMISSLHQNSLQNLEEEVAGLHHLEMFLTGSSTNLRIVRLNMEIRARKRRPNIMPRVTRPSAVSFEPLQAVFNMIRTLLPRLEATQKSIGQDITEVQSSISLLASIGEVIKRLEGQNKAVEDVWMPVIGFLNLARAGLWLVSMPKTDAQQSNSMQQMLVRIPMMAERHSSWPGDRLLQPIEVGGHELNAHRLNLRLLALVEIVEQQPSVKSKIQEQALTTFGHLYSLWRHNVDSKQRQATAESSLYRYRGAASTLR